MPVATKTRPAAPYRDDAARVRLAEAKTTLASIQVELQAAQEAHDQASRAYWLQQNTASEITARRKEFAEQYSRVHWVQREEIQRKYDDCAEPERQAKLPLMELGRVEEAAAAKLKEVDQRVSFYRSRVREAAEAVVRAEAPALVEPMVPALRDAYATICALGPDLFYLIDNRLVGPDVMNALGSLGQVLNPLQGWDQSFGTRYRASPWRGAVAVLEADTDAALPISSLT